MLRAASFVPEVRSVRWLTSGPDLTVAPHRTAAHRLLPFLPLGAYRRRFDDLFPNAAQFWIASHRWP
jgi:hypothetical protein